MAERILFPQWPAENDPTKYPFGLAATLTNGQQTLLEGIMLDAALYPIGGGESLRLSKVVVTHETVTLYVGDELVEELASGSFDTATPPASLALADAYDRPAGLLVSAGTRLGLLASWGLGTFTFTAAQTEFAATCCAPTPEVGLRGLLLDDGTLLTGPVWLIGDDGIVLRRETAEVPDPVDPLRRTLHCEVIRVDAVGDPLFRRKLCLSQPELFQATQFLTSLTFQDDYGNSAVVTPDAHGDVKVTVNNAAAGTTVLRVRASAEGTRIEAVGSVLKDVR